MLTKDYIKATLSSLPDKPGVYQFIDGSGSILYVGKAKNLKKRIASYFHKKTDGKTTVMVNKTMEIRHFVTETESDALLLENNLVKKHQPRYNILLKDDKTFPWICIRNERFPRVFLTRNVLHDGSEYFGPYTSVHTVRTLLELIRQLYPVRTCSYLLSQELIERKKYKVCLEYHLGNCKGPCEGFQDEMDYNQSILQIKQILKGNIQDVIHFIGQRMEQSAREYRFEEAELYKQKQEALKRFQSKSSIVNPAIKHVDVFSIVSGKKQAFVNFIKVVNGAIIQTHTIELRKMLNETDEELLLTAIIDLRERLGSQAGEALVPFALKYKLEGVNFRVPRIGDKKKLLDLSERNARYYQMEKTRQEEARTREEKASRILKIVQNDLNLNSLPVHIECFDNSNIQGKYPVSACVVFRGGKPLKKDYRQYNIKTVSGPDDYASMEEVVYRRYRRMIDEGQSLPQLIIIDGGKGQLNAALVSLEQLGIRTKVAVIGIAKRLEEIYLPGDKVPLYLDKKSVTLKLIQQIRDEAHRFGIRFHRLKRSNDFVRSELDKIQGIGPETIKKLYIAFKTVKEIADAGIDKLSSVIGPSKAIKVYGYFHDQHPVI